MEAEVKSGNSVPNVNYIAPADWKQDKFAWAFLGLLVISVIVDIILLINGEGFNTTLPYLFCVAIIAAIEEKRAKKAGIAWPSNWLCLIIPVYLWKRLTSLKQPRTHFWIWTGVFVLSLILTFGFMPSEGSELKSEITQQLRERGVTTTCKKVVFEIKKDDVWVGLAYFDSGEKVAIIYHPKDGSWQLKSN